MSTADEAMEVLADLADDRMWVVLAGGGAKIAFALIRDPAGAVMWVAPDRFLRMFKAAPPEAQAFTHAEARRFQSRPEQVVRLSAAITLAAEMEDRRLSPKSTTRNKSRP